MRELPTFPRMCMYVCFLCHLWRRRTADGANVHGARFADVHVPGGRNGRRSHDRRDGSGRLETVSAHGSGERRHSIQVFIAKNLSVFVDWGSRRTRISWHLQHPNNDDIVSHFTRTLWKCQHQFVTCVCLYVYTFTRTPRSRYGFN